MYKILTAVAVWMLFQFLSLSAIAQTTPDAQAILKKVNQTYRNLKSYQFEYNMVSDSKTERENLTSTSHYESRGRVTAVRPARIHFERQDPHSSVIFAADGQTVWMYSSELNGFTKRAAGTVEIFAAPKSTDTNHEALAREANRKVEGYAQLATEPRNLALLPNEMLTIGGRQIDCYVLEFTQGMGSNKTNTRYWIDRERYLVLREVVDSVYRKSPGSITKYTQLFNFTAATINEPAADSAFSYTPPKSAVELDRLDNGALARKRNAPVNWIGQAAPDFTLTDMDGKTVSLQSLRGKVVLLNFWATWCGPCRTEMPHLEKLHREYKNKDIVILGIDDEEAEVVQAYLKKNGYTFNTLIDPEKQVSRQYKISAIPQSFFITKDGVIAAYARGMRSESEFRDGIKRALAGKIEEPTPSSSVSR